MAQTAAEHEANRTRIRAQFTRAEDALYEEWMSTGMCCTTRDSRMAQLRRQQGDAIASADLSYRLQAGVLS